MTRWRERAIREVRNELDRFLNFPLSQSVVLGDYGTYDGKASRFQWEGNIKQLGLEFEENGFQHEIAETYATSGAVTIQGRLSLLSNRPSVDVGFSRTSALAFRGFKIGFSQVQLAGLSKAFGSAIRDGLKWDRKKVVVTQVWEASGFTQLVAGGRKANVQIEASIPEAASAGGIFNFADPGLLLDITAQRSMSYCAVGLTDVKPYFMVHKLRETEPGLWGLYRYGSPS